MPDIKVLLEAFFTAISAVTIIIFTFTGKFINPSEVPILTWIIIFPLIVFSYYRLYKGYRD